MSAPAPKGTVGQRLRALLSPGEAGEARTAGSRRVAGNVGLQYAGRILGLVTSLATLPLITRTLGSDGFGVYSAAIAYVGIFSSLTEFGLTSAATMRMSADPEHEKEWLGALASLRAVVSLATVVVCAAAIPIVFDEREPRVAALVLTGTIAFAGAGALMSVFASRLRSGIPVAISILQSLLWLGAVLALAVTDAGPVVVCAAYAAMRGVIALVQVRVTRKFAGVVWRGARARWASLLKIAVPTGLAYVFITIYFSLDTVLLLELGGADEAGVYGAAYRFLTPLLIFPQAVMGTVFPVLSALQGRDDVRLKRIVQRCADYMAVSTLPVLAVTVVLAGPLVGLLFGDEFERTAVVLPILMIAYVAIGYGTMAGFLAPVLGLQWRLTLYAGIGAVVNVILNVLLIPQYGAVGSAWATVATEVLTMGLLLATCLKGLGLRLAPGRIAATVAAAGAMALAMLATRPLGLLPALLTGGITYPLALLALRAVRIDELRELARR